MSPVEWLSGRRLTSSSMRQRACDSENVVAPIWPIPILFHPFPTILLTPKAGEIDFADPVAPPGFYIEPLEIRDEKDLTVGQFYKKSFG